MAMKLSSNLQLLLLTRALMETLERETFDRYTKSNQTLIDVSTPEEMRWLAMFPKIPPADLPKELRQRFALVASDANVGLQWIDPAFAQQLCVVASRLLDHEPPFVVMTLRGRLYLRLQLEEPKAAAVTHALALFQAAATAASNLRSSKDAPADWPTTSSTAWTDLGADDEPKR